MEFNYAELNKKNDLSYFPHARGFRNDRRIKIMMKKIGVEAYQIVLMVTEVLLEQIDLKYPIDNDSLLILADEVHTTVDKLKAVIFHSGLFSVSDETFFFSPGLNSSLNPLFEMREQWSLAGKKSAEVRANKRLMELEAKQEVNDVPTALEQRSNNVATTFQLSKVKLSKEKLSKDKISKDKNSISSISMDPVSSHTVSSHIVDPTVDQQQPLSKSSLYRIQHKEFMESLHTNPLYRGLDIDKCLSDMDLYIKDHPKQRKTRVFVTQWLERELGKNGDTTEINDITETQSQPISDESFKTQNTYQYIKEEWNKLCMEYPELNSIQEITQKRREHLRARLINKNFVFSDIISAIKQSTDFLVYAKHSNAKHPNWRVSFDWLIENDTNYIKVLELKYKNKTASEQDVPRTAEGWRMHPETVEKLKKYGPQ